MNVASGTFHKQIPGLISVDTLFVSDAVGSYDLKKYYYTFENFKRAFGDLTSDWDTGPPCAWTIGRNTLSPDMEKLTGAEFDALALHGAGEVRATERWDQEQILWFPLLDQEYTLNLTGAFYSRTLRENEDSNFWTEVHPDLLALTTAYILEGRMRNRQGQAEWLQAIEDRIHLIEVAFVEREMVGQEMELNG